VQDYSKVDRSAAYAARWVAKSLVTAGLCRRALVQLSYAIGVAQPLSIFVETYGTSQYTSSQLVKIIRKNFDLRPGVLGTNTPASTFFISLYILFPLCLHFFCVSGTNLMPCVL
jgi:S-adenosylmethionine synthetase